MLIELLRWWYGPGWLHAFKRIQVRTRNVSHAFSMPILLKTLFSPWKRIVTSGAKGIDAKVQAMLNNAISRLVGFVTRFVVLITALFMTSGTFIGSVVVALVWPTIPVLIIFCLVKGFL